ncbi:MAG: undecaprenyl-diphosphate phosphatase [Candidatus Omnitrophica bacterium]|nr:undecaprenyl-diphosphate phosphatase [Candidatus Omnitrophota bacterium]
MTLWQAVLLGVVEGITEFLPISSTGHLILTARLIRLPATEFLKSFEIAIQLGAMLSVVVVYARRLAAEPKVWARIFAAFIPTAVVGLVLYKFIKRYLMASEATVLWALVIGGIILIVFERYHRENPAGEENLSALSFRDCFLIGLFQSLAVIPGVSRSAATIIGGLALGLRRKTVVEFSFLLAVPTLAAATGLDLLKSGASFTAGEFGLLAVGFLVSLAVALLSIRFLLHFIKNHNFTVFGWYRIVLGVLFWLI